MRAPLSLLAAFLLAAGSAGADCDDIPANVFNGSNCGFDSVITPWTLPTGASIMHSAVEGHPDAGSAEIGADGSSGFLGEALVQSGCVALSPGTYGFGMHFMTPDGVDVSCRARVVTYTDAGCDAGSFVDIVDGSSESVSGIWTLSNGTITASASTVAATIDGSCLTFSSPFAFTMFADNAFLGDGLVPVELQSFSVN